MKFYIASKLNDRNVVKRVIKEIVDRGHEVILDWTKDSLLEKPYTKKQKVAEKRAQRDIDAVLESDVFILITEKEANNKGMYVELGAAMASHIKYGKPRVFVAGDFIEHGVFFFHPSVNKVKTIEEVFRKIELLPAVVKGRKR